MKRIVFVAVLLAKSLCALQVQAQVDARLLRHLDVSQTEITFVYAGDIWIAPKGGGVAHRLSSAPGQESFPRFSPDGSRIVFSGNYDGNTDLYLLPTAGGTLKRLTHHPDADRVLDWYPEGDAVLTASRMHSGIQRYNQFYRISDRGGLPEKLPIAYGETAALSPDGRQLAYTPTQRTSSSVWQTWKRYRGGMAPDIWLFDLSSFEARNITNNPANDTYPMWHERTVYFLSDRGPAVRNNLWAFSLDDESLRQVTHFTDFDIYFPAIGPSDIVFQAGGQLYLLDLATEQFKPIDIQVITDLAHLKPRVETVDKMIRHTTVSPNGKRAVLEARGDLFSLPVEHGPVYNLTQSPGVAERYPAWSPDGKHLAYWTDRNGESQLALRPADGSGKEELPPRNDEITPWDSLGADQKKREVRKMELYAAMVENLDYHVGRLIKHLESNDLIDQTFIVFMSDNGAAGEDFYNRGRFKDYVTEHYDNSYDNMGQPDSWVSYGPQWAEAGSAPFSRYKGYTRQGGIVAPMIIAGAGVAVGKSIISSYVTVMDLAPTFIELGEAVYPTSEPIRPMLGESMVSLLNGSASSVHDDTYTTTLSHAGNAFVRQGRWKLVSGLSWPFEESKFELFDIEADPGETTNLVDKEPEQFKRMIELWREQRQKLGIVVPYDL